MQERNHIDFSLVVTNEGLVENAKSRIAFITGIQPSQVRDAEVATLQHDLYLGIDRAHTRDLFDKYIQKSPEERIEATIAPKKRPRRQGVVFKRTLGEKRQTFRQQAEIIGREETHWLSYGVSAPAYHQALTEHRVASETAPSNHQSLLVGALTPETVNEYAVVTDHVFPNAELHVVDIEGATTKTACTANVVKWHRGDCLAMPFPPNTFDTVQSNYLFNNMHSPHAAGDVRQFLEIYFQQVFDILKSQGRIIGVEATITGGMLTYLDYLAAQGQMESYVTEKNNIKEEYKEELQFLLQSAGFIDVQLRPAASFTSRMDLDRTVMLGNTWDFSQSPKDSASLLITAVKP